MEWVLVLGLLALALLGAPLLAIFAAAAMLLFAGLADTPMSGAASDIFSDKFADSPLLVTIPLFTFAGYLMAEAGTPRRLVRVSRALLGWMPGGLAMVCIVASAFFTSFTGGSGITIVAIGGLLYPALIAENYPEKFSLGLVTTSGSLGLLFPPSVPIVLFAVVAGIEVEKLFIAGIVPGVLTVIALGVFAAYKGLRIDLPRQKFEMKEAFSALREAIWELILPIVLIAALFFGVLRIHEAAAFTALYVLIVEVWVYKDVKFGKDLPRIITESMTLVGAILAILATAIGFTGYLIQDQLPMKILEAMSTLITDKIMFLLVLNVFLLMVGMLMDIFSAIVVVVPLILPIARQFGVNDYHLGIVFLLNLEIGYMTPPVGLNLFIASFRFEKPVTLLYKAVIPFIGLLIVALLVTTYWEDLSLAMLPDGAGDNEQVGQEIDPLEDDLEDDYGGGGLDDLEDDFGGGGLDALEDELGGGGGLDELEDELGGDDFDLDALEDELGGEEPGEGEGGESEESVEGGFGDLERELGL